jgi:hypothetical protein
MNIAYATVHFNASNGIATFVKRKWILKWYWKRENVTEVQKRRGMNLEFVTAQVQKCGKRSDGLDTVEADDELNLYSTKHGSPRDKKRNINDHKIDWLGNKKNRKTSRKSQN